MAKKEEAPKIVLERTYVIPVHQETLKVPPFKKANKTVKAIFQFLTKHMKSKDVHIGKYLNLEIWKHGAKNPPHKVKVNVTKDDKGRVTAELFGAPKDEPKVESKSTKKGSKTDSKQVKEAEFKVKPAEKLEAEVDSAKEEQADEAKKIEKEELKELKKEQKEQHPASKHAPKETQKTKFQQEHQVAPKHL
ncbi:MAG TPA: hypothetical protein VI564_02680 [Candidatus Nanoarchaeia archaeon]|nr:hypothetical protein [Candidatus Nanoarchaeia archaeon]